MPAGTRAMTAASAWAVMRERWACGMVLVAKPGRDGT
jgi:hypothetical protein